MKQAHSTPGASDIVVGLLHRYKSNFLLATVLLSSAGLVDYALPVAAGSFIGQVGANARVVLTGLCTALVCLAVVRWSAFFFATTLVVGASDRAILRLQFKLLRHVHRLSERTVDLAQPGSLEAAVVEGGWSVEALFTVVFLAVFTSASSWIAGTVVVGRLNSWVALSSALIPAVLLIYDRRTARGTRIRTQRVERIRIRAYGALEDAWTTYREEWNYGRQRRPVRCVVHHLRQLCCAELSADRFRNSRDTWSDALASVVMVACLAAGASQLSHNRISRGHFVLLGAALSVLLRASQAASYIVRDFGSAAGRVDEAARTLSLPVETGRRSSGSAPPERLASVRLRDVTYAYTEAQPVLHQASLTLRPGEVVAVVGASGCGKTTLLKLLCGVLRPSAGNILVNGVNLTELDVDAFRRKIGIVPQDNQLLCRTIADNIRYGCPTASADAVHAAAAVAQCDQFVKALPDGYSYSLSRGGLELSAGQRQRIALARALLASSWMLLLDEAMSGVDQVTEERIWLSLRACLGARICVVVSHRRKTARFADRVVKLVSGVLVESGCEETMSRDTCLNRR